MIDKNLQKRIGTGALLAVGGIGLAILAKNLFRKNKTINPPVLPVIGASISDDEAQIIAKGQLAAMDILGTNERDLIDPLKNLTGKDLKKVYNKFGQVCYNGYTTCVGIDKYLGGRDLDLFGWYAEELNEDEREEMREIWKKTGLSLPF